MTRFLLRKLLYMVALIGTATLVAYILAATQLRPRARFELQNPQPSESTVDSILTARNLNDKTPVLERMGIWISALARGDFGQTVEGESVNAEIGRRMWVSLRLMLLGAILGCALGVAGGAYAAVRQYKPFDLILGTGSFIILSTPVVVLAVMLKVAGTYLNNALGFTGATRLIYTTGEYTPGINFWTWAGLMDRLGHLVLPTMTLMCVGIAIYSRYQRNSMLDVLGSDFLRTARAKGLPRSHALIKHGLRTAVIPLFTYFSYQFALLFVGATFTEKIFSWHGMGEYFVDAVTNNDVNSVAGIAVFVAFLVLIAGIVSDLAHAVLDPRVRTE